MAVKNRALALATRGILSGAAITLATHGIIQVESGPASVDALDSTHRHVSGPMVWETVEAPEDKYYPLPYKGGGTSTRIDVKEYEELLDAFPKSRSYESQITLALRSLSTWYGYSEPKQLYGYTSSAKLLLFNVGQSSGYAAPYVPPLRSYSHISIPGIGFESFTRSYRNLNDGFAPLSALYLQSGSVYGLNTPAIYRQIPTVLVDSDTLTTYQTPERLLYTIKGKLNLDSQSLMAFELGKETVFVLVEEPPVEHVQRGRIILPLKIDVNYTLQEQVVDIYEFDGSGSIQISGTATYQLSTVDVQSYRFSSGGGSVVNGTATAVLSRKVVPIVEKDVDAEKRKKDDEDIIMILASLMFEDD